MTTTSMGTRRATLVGVPGTTYEVAVVIVRPVCPGFPRAVKPDWTHG